MGNHPFIQNAQLSGEEYHYRSAIRTAIEILAQTHPNGPWEKPCLRFARSFRRIRSGLLFVPAFHCRYALGGFLHLGGAPIDWLLLKGIPFDPELTNQLQEWLNAD